MNVHVQCCGIILLIVLLYFYSGQRKVRLNTERAFLRIYISAFINLILDISSIVAITYRDTLPDMLVELVCKFYVMTLVLVNLFSMLYVCADIYIDKKEYSTIQNRFTVFSVIGMIFVLILPIYINAEERNKTYTYGLSVIVTYISVFVIIFSTIYLIKRYKSRLNQKRRESVLIWFTIWTRLVLPQWQLFLCVQWMQNIFRFRIQFPGIIILAGMVGIEFTKEELLDKATLYMQIYFCGMPALAVFNFGNAVYSAIGNTRKPLV